MEVPVWRLRGEAKVSLFHLSLKAIAKSPDTALGEEKWAILRDRFRGEKPHVHHAGELQTAIVRAIIKHGSMADDTIPLSFFTSDLQTLDVAGAGRLSPKFLSAVIAQCPNLLFVDFTSCFNVLDATVVTLVTTCRALRKLSLEGCRAITSASVDAIVANTPMLTSINVAGCYNLTLPAVNKLVCTHPNSANFVDVQVSGVAFDMPLLSHVGSTCRLLQSFGAGFSNIAKAGLEPVVSGCRALRHLRLHWCPMVNDISLGMVAAMCVNLESLDIVGAKGLTSKAIQGFVQARALPRAPPLPPAELGLRKLTKLNARFTALTDTEAATLRDLHPGLVLTL